MPDPVSAAPGSWQEALRDIGERLGQPTERLSLLLQDLVARAVTVVGAAEGSIMVPGEAGFLRFLVSHGPSASKVAGLKVPVAGSIAGYVFGTGQMMALGDLSEEKPPQFYAEVDKQTGIATRTYMVVPILNGSRVSGVATYVNRRGGPPFQPFQKQDMEQARMFAAVEAVLLRHLERTRQLAQLAANDLAAALSALAPGAPALAAPAPGAELHQDLGVRALQQME